MKNARGTLDGEAYTFNPMTETDTWARPCQFLFKDDHKDELPLGADDSAMPLFNADYLRNGGPTVGSDETPEWKRSRAAQQAQMEANTYLTAFVVIGILAIWFSRSSGPGPIDTDNLF